MGASEAGLIATVFGLRLAGFVLCLLNALRTRRGRVRN